MANTIYKDNSVVFQGATSYNDLLTSSLPSINSVTLQGNMTSSELGVYSKSQVDQLLSQVRNVKASETVPSSPTANTLYYVGTGNPYSVYLYVYDEEGTLTRLDLGTTTLDLSDYQKKEDDSLTTTSQTVVGAINELKTDTDTKQPIADNSLTTDSKTVPSAINELDASLDLIPRTYAGIYISAVGSNGATSADSCVFDLTNTRYDTYNRRIANAGENLQRKYEARPFNLASMTDPVTSNAVYGTCVTEEYSYDTNMGTTARSFVWQTFLSNFNRTYNLHSVFKRAGLLTTGGSDFYTSKDSITWYDWYPVEYPVQALSSSQMSDLGLAGAVKYIVNGGILFLFMNVTQSSVSTTIFPAGTFPTLPKRAIENFTTLHSTASGVSTLLGCGSASTTNTAINWWGATASTAYWGTLQVPMGY